MKDFFKFMFASMLGFILTLVIAVFIFIAMVASFLSFAEQEVVAVENNTVLHMKLDQEIHDRAPKDPFGMLTPLSMEFQHRQGLNDLLASLEKAARDPRISGIYLDLSAIQAGMATIEEIRNGLMAFRESGKFIIAYGEMYSQAAYYIATAADKVYLNPDGLIDFRGMSAEVMFLKGTLEKLDINVNVIRHGKYKSAVEPFILDKLSEDNRQQLQEMISDMWSRTVEGISASRNIPADEINRIADKLEGMNADKAMESGLVDGLYYKDQVIADLKGRLNLGDEDHITTLDIAKYTLAEDPLKKKFTRDKIAVIYALGSIMDGKGDDLTIGSQRISEAIRTARKDNNVKAIVMRVNSPGGSALASEVIRREVELASEVKPFVVSMGDLAASGGYWISCSADRIIADATTITGSIGVFGMFPEMGEFFENKLGITFDYVNTNENSDFPSLTRKLPPYQQEVMEREIDRIYTDFLGLVADGRNMTVEQVDMVAQGRVWSAKAAREIGLVDEIGGLKKALETAADLAGIEDYRLYELPFQKDPLQQLFEQLKGETRATWLKSELGEYYGYFNFIREMSRHKGVIARMPYDIRIN